MAAKRRLGDNLGSASPTWDPDPTGVAVKDAAREWLQHRISRRLLDRGLDARALTEALGGSTSGWQSKLNGTRALQLTDLLALVIALDSDLLTVLPPRPADLSEFVAPEYAEWLSHSALEAGMPTFREPPQDPDWLGFAAEMEGWWRSEVQEGRAWAITRQVLVHAVLVHGPNVGLEPARAAIAVDGDVVDIDNTSHVDIDWPSRRTRVRVVGLPETEGRPTSADVALRVTETANLLWQLAESSDEHKILLLAAPQVITENLTDAANLASGNPGEWTVLGLSEARRLGCEARALAAGDLQAQVLHPLQARHVACIRVK